METVHDQMHGVLRGILKKPDLAALADETRLFEDLNLDSTSTLEFLIALEEVIPGLIIDPATLQLEHFKTVGNLVGYIRENIQGNA
jgi:acyl carrier protein